MTIAEYFLEHSEIRDEHVRQIKEGSSYLKQEIQKFNLRYHGGEYTNGIIIFLKSKQDSDNVVSFLKEKKIYIRGSFEAPFETTIRISIGIM